MKTNKPKILFYDIETLPLKSYVWGCGDQVVRHPQLMPNGDTWGLICITYCWNDNRPVKIIKCTPEGGIVSMIEEFDKIIAAADITIGKNSDRFDTKMINTQRMLSGLPGNPSWTKYTDDLEKQMRKYFRLPSQSLDYISNQLGLGGKIKMEFKDWVDIDRYFDYLNLERKLNCLQVGDIETLLFAYCTHVFKADNETIIKLGTKAFNKMCFYGKKDTRDTRTLWNKLSSHFDSKLNAGAFLKRDLACKHCGSCNLILNGTRISGKTKWQIYNCKDCGSYAGRGAIKSINKKVLS